MKRSMTKRQLMSAYKRTEKQISALYKVQSKLESIAAKRCSLMVGDIVEVVEHCGRKHWGEVNRIDGRVFENVAGWEVALRNTRKHGGWIGGWFRLRDDTTRQWKIIGRVKAAQS